MRISCPVAKRLCVLAVLLLFSAVAGPAQSGWTPELEMKMKNVAAVRISPDGKKVVYTVSSPVMTPDKSEFVTQIWLANTDGTGAVQLTYAEKSSDNPRWSPDGQMLAFTSARSGKNNLYVLRLIGGESEQLTDVKSAVNNFQWSPDGSRIAFVMRDGPTDDEEKVNKGKDDWRWIDENVKLSRLNIISLNKDANGKREPRILTKEGNIQGDFDWSPDGKTIVFTRTRMPKADYWTSSDLYEVDVASGAVKTLAATNASESAPSFSPDGKWISFSVSDDPPRWAGYQRIAVIPAGGGSPPRLLAETFDSQPGVIDWSGDGKRIYFTETHGTVTRVSAMDIATGSITEINKGNEVLTGISLNRDRTMLAFTMQSSDKAPEAFVTSLQNFAPVQVSRANADLPKLAFGKTEVIKWKSKDGQEIEGLLTYPVDYKAGTRVPLLLGIHGGPAGVFTQSYLASRSPYPVASFASRGYAVLRPNPRGSSGYGQKFRFANIKDWGGGDYHDVMSGVDHVIAMGVGDPERLGVMGWSYGGFMTSWVITQTKRFKAASVGAAVTNLMSFIGTADIPSFIPDYFGGQPWENLEIYRTHSAMFNAKGVSTPTLIQHGEADERVPISQGYEFYNALKVQNVPVRMITFPRMPHGLTEPKMILKSKQTNLEWFDKYVRTGATPGSAGSN